MDDFNKSRMPTAIPSYFQDVPASPGRSGVQDQQGSLKDEQNGLEKKGFQNKNEEIFSISTTAT